MAAHQPLPRGRIFLALAGREFGKADLAARPEDVVLGDEPVDRLSHRRGQGVVGRAHIGEFGLAAAQSARRRHCHRVQHAQHHRHRHIGGIGVPQPVAEAVEPAPVVERAQPAVLVEVGDVADLWVLEPPSAAARRRPADLERPEPRREIAQLRIVEALVAKHQHGITIDRLPDRLDHRRIDRPGEVDAIRLGGKQRMKLAQFEAHAIFP